MCLLPARPGARPAHVCAGASGPSLGGLPAGAAQRGSGGQQLTAVAASSGVDAARSCSGQPRALSG
eukprot:13406598-Alexandrium_andersonii.AAC.1